MAFEMADKRDEIEDLFYNSAVTPDGASYEGGLSRMRSDDEQTDLLSGELGLGKFALDGEEARGMHAGGRLVGRKADLGDGWSDEMDALSANADCYETDSTASLGAQANLGSFALSHTDKDPRSASDTSVRAGVSAGVGLGGRTHYGDADHDGYRELGFGFDLGPVSFDIKSEAIDKAREEVGYAMSDPIQRELEYKKQGIHFTKYRGAHWKELEQMEAMNYKLAEEAKLIAARERMRRQMPFANLFSHFGD